LWAVVVAVVATGEVVAEEEEPFLQLSHLLLQILLIHLSLGQAVQLVQTV
jgi:hypothetical protein